MSLSLYVTLTLVWTVGHVIACLYGLWQLVARLTERAAAQQRGLQSVARFRYSARLRASATYVTISALLAVLGYFQLTFPPVQPHSTLNVVRTGVMLVIAALLIIVNVLDGRSSGERLQAFEDRYVADVRTAALSALGRVPDGTLEEPRMPHI